MARYHYKNFRSLSLLAALTFFCAPLSAHADSATTTLVGTGTSYNGTVLSSDGTTVTGKISGGDGFVWTSTGGITAFGQSANVTPVGISSNGSIVLGYFNTNHLFRWTAGGGFVDEGAAAGGGTIIANQAFGSINGNTIAYTTFLSGHAIADYWTLGGGFTTIGTDYSVKALSADGGTVALTSTTGAAVSSIWTQGGGFQSIGTLGGITSTANAISANGSVVVGQSAPSSGAPEAFRWTSGGGMVALGYLESSQSSTALGLTPDGSVVFGTGNTSNGANLFRWTAATGTVDEGQPTGGIGATPKAISADGNVIVGQYSYIVGGSAYQHPMLWTPTTGTKDLVSLLSGAGVDVTSLDFRSAIAVSADGKFMLVATGFNASYIVTYTPSTNTGGATTIAAQQDATQKLSQQQHAAMIESRATANQLLGQTRPMTSNSYAFVGGMFGSQEGMAGEQYAHNGFSITGGFATGSQEYPGIKQSDAPTVAVALRYTFGGSVDNKQKAWHPFVEAGGWTTPHETLTLSRSYANGTGASTGEGSTKADSFAAYGRLGTEWNMDKKDSFTLYGDMGQQRMDFDSYSEGAGPSNPFPASVSGGLVRYNYAKLGGTWTRDLGKISDIPLSFTVAGAAARSFDMHSGLTTNVAGIGAISASDQEITWGEFGAQMNFQVLQSLTLSAGFNGTTAAQPAGTQLHGDVGLTFNF